MSRLLGLYPRSWRERYGEEFLILLSERPPSFRDRIDIVRGAVDARLHPQLIEPQRGVDRSWLAPLAGFGLLIGALLLMANGPLQHDDYGSYRDGSAALVPFVAALGLLSFGIYRLMDRLRSRSRGPRSAAWIAIIAGTLWSIMPWVALAGLAFLVGILGFAIGAWRAGALQGWIAAILAALMVAPTAVFVATFFVPWYTMRESGPNFLVVIGPLSGLWLLVGLGLLHGSSRLPTTAAPRPIQATR